ncbi:reverse transcriptase domain-containing protein [Tanacetum coccineum]
MSNNIIFLKNQRGFRFTDTLMTSNNVTFIASFILLIMEYLVKISNKARILELKRRNVKITILTTTKETRSIRRIQGSPIRRIQAMEIKYSGRYQTWSLLQETLNTPYRNLSIRLQKRCSTQEPVPRPSILYQPSKKSNPPFPSRLKKQKKDDKDECLLSIFKQIYTNLPFLEALIHMPKGDKVLKDLLSHKEKLEKATSSIKLSEECSATIQKSLPQKEGDPGSFTLPCLIRPVAIKNALADLGASINLMPHSLFQRLGISKLKPTKMSIQLAERSIKYPIGVYENLLVKVGKFIFPVDFVVLEMDKDELVPIILGRPFLATARHPWVSPFQVIPKKGGMTVVKNEKDEFTLQRTVIGWHVCIDYHKLNNATQKDHFPLPFIDQMLERLTGHEYYCFLDRFFAYFQIPIAPED